MSRRERKASLRSRMSWRTLVPLALTWLLGSAVAFVVAYLSTREAFDRSLLDDAYAIAANVSEREGELSLDLTLSGLQGILFDRRDKLYYAVMRPDGRVVAGTEGLHPAVAGAGAAAEVIDAVFNGTRVRAATVRREEPRPFAVVVAQTTIGRGELLRQLLAYSVAPQVVLLLLIGWWLRRSIGHELEPLGRLQQALEQRDSTDLTPVNVTARSADVERLTQTVNALMGRIHHGVQAQRQFAGNVAHELRTPLAGIRALAEYGLAQKDPAVWQAQLRSVAASQERASRLVDQLLALALADEASDSVVLEPLLIDELVHETVLHFLPRADAAGVDLGAVGLDRPVRAMASRELLEGLLNNLIDNALRYGRPADGSTPRVTVELATEGDAVLLAVADNGPGMDLRHRDQLLRRWAQGAAGVKLGEGAGLGLAIVSRYAALLLGQFSLGAGADGRGMRAAVRLRSA
jgi:two-component system sensor histidine kinase TctE